MAGRQAGFYWQSETLFKNVATFKPKLHRAVTEAVEYTATRGETAMRGGASWHDQTGAARSGLHTVTEHSSTRHTIIFAHAVSYGIWLEVRWSGRYAIIMPSVQDGGQQLMRLLGNLLGRVGT